MELSNLIKMLGNPALLQQQLKELQERLATVSVTGTAGGNMASVTLNGAMQITNVYLSPEIFASGDVVIVQDLFKAAYNDAQARLKEAMKNSIPANISGLPGDINQENISLILNNLFKQ